MQDKALSFKPFTVKIGSADVECFYSCTVHLTRTLQTRRRVLSTTSSRMGFKTDFIATVSNSHRKKIETNQSCLKFGYPIFYQSKKSEKMFNENTTLLQIVL